MLIAHVEATGVWLIDGGIHALAEALRNVAQGKGAKFRMGTQVAQILTERGKGAVGVRLANGDTLQADAVICNADPGAIAAGCFGEGSASAVSPLPPAKRSLSAMVWFAHTVTSGFDLTHHNVFFSSDYRREFDQIARGETPSNPSVYVCAQDRSGHAGSAAQLAHGPPRAHPDHPSTRPPMATPIPTLRGDCPMHARD